ncbi:Rrf2 family transcriptional regulator [Jeotgalibacillus sp. JSM ZJ347]|uniref:RrF2 family transcriptional regulator n=1 Tax=Jeotgalibacillus sp. JSM ZJ347 TaxID=3342117 RepID=UPI0035A98423
MKLTNGVEQAICILVLLATQEKQIPVATDVISKKLEVSPSYLKKIMRKLVVKDIIKSVPGSKGGVTLAKDPGEITMLDIVVAMEGEMKMFPDKGLIEKVFNDSENAGRGQEIFRNVFHGADQQLVEYFSSITGEDLLKQGFGDMEPPHLDWNELTDDEKKSGESK